MPRQVRSDKTVGKLEEQCGFTHRCHQKQGRKRYTVGQETWNHPKRTKQ